MSLVFELDDAAKEIILREIHLTRNKNFEIAPFAFEFADSVWTSPMPFQGEIEEIYFHPESKSVFAKFNSDFSAILDAKAFDPDAIVWGFPTPVTLVDGVPVRDYTSFRSSRLLGYSDNGWVAAVLYLGHFAKYGVSDVHFVQKLDYELSGLVLDLE